jgi:hypothetical protein
MFSCKVNIINFNMGIFISIPYTMNAWRTTISSYTANTS